MRQSILKACTAALVAAWVCLAGGASLHAALLTDTTADYNSSVQGVNGYHYGYDLVTYGTPGNPSTFALSTPDGAGSWVGPYTSGCCGAAQFPVVFQTGGHGITNPNAESGGGSEANMPFGTAASSDRQWTSTFTGTINISGGYQALNNCCGSNQTVRLYVNGVEVFEDTVGAGTANGYNAQTYSVNTSIVAGQKIDWVTDPNLGYYGDATNFFGTVNSLAAVPEPASIALLGIGGLALVRRRFAR